MTSANLKVCFPPVWLFDCLLLSFNNAAVFPDLKTHLKHDVIINDQTDDQSYENTTRVEIKLR